MARVPAQRKPPPNVASSPNIAPRRLQLCDFPALHLCR